MQVKTIWVPLLWHETNWSYFNAEGPQLFSISHLVMQHNPPQVNECKRLMFDTGLQTCWLTHSHSVEAFCLDGSFLEHMHAPFNCFKLWSAVKWHIHQTEWSAALIEHPLICLQRLSCPLVAVSGTDTATWLSEDAFVQSRSLFFWTWGPSWGPTSRTPPGFLFGNIQQRHK